MQSAKRQEASLLQLLQLLQLHSLPLVFLRFAAATI